MTTICQGRALRAVGAAIAACRRESICSSVGRASVKERQLERVIMQSYASLPDGSDEDVSDAVLSDETSFHVANPRAIARTRQSKWDVFIVESQYLIDVFF